MCVYVIVSCFLLHPLDLSFSYEPTYINLHNLLQKNLSLWQLGPKSHLQAYENDGSGYTTFHLRQDKARQILRQQKNIDKPHRHKSLSERKRSSFSIIENENRLFVLTTLWCKRGRKENPTKNTETWGNVPALFENSPMFHNVSHILHCPCLVQPGICQRFAYLTFVHVTCWLHILWFTSAVKQRFSSKQIKDTKWYALSRHQALVEFVTMYVFS